MTNLDVLYQGALTAAKAAVPIDPMKRSPDAEFILDLEELDEYDWFERQVKPSQFINWRGQAIGTSSTWALDDEERVRKILGYWKAYKSPAEAVAAYPILAFQEGRKFRILDGGHRIRAWQTLGLRGPLTTIVGRPHR